jgi:ribosomal protein L11 methyltransferase
VTDSPALIITIPAGASTGWRDLLTGVLAGHSVLAIHEDAITDSQRWIAHFPDAASRDAARADLTHGREWSLEVEAVEIPDEDWARRTQADLPAIRIGRVTIAPPWDIPASTAAPGFRLRSSYGGQVSRSWSGPTNPDVLVVIEPSRGFGTGHHQSTRLCITLLQCRNLAGLTVTDVGTGSGVLAITAAKLGAAQVEAIDSDSDAVENARENIERNAVTSTVRAHVQDLTEPPPKPADVVTANLTGTLLARHAGTLRRFVKPGGTLIVSGFNVEERQMVAEAFEPDLMIGESAEEDDWWAFVLTRGG